MAPLALAMAAPVLAQEAGRESTRSRRPAVFDPPLSALTVDAAPRLRNGQYADPEGLPASRWADSGREGPAKFIDGSATCPLPGCRDLLQLARFYHRPLYVDDDALERYGDGGCLPCVGAVGEFMLDAALLPVRLICTPPCACVLSPTPTCARPCWDCCR